jgi:hypothetical protein
MLPIGARRTWGNGRGGRPGRGWRVDRRVAYCSLHLRHQMLLLSDDILSQTADLVIVPVQKLGARQFHGRLVPGGHHPDEVTVDVAGGARQRSLAMSLTATSLANRNCLSPQSLTGVRR